MSNNIKYNSPKWFNSYTAKLLDNFNQYDKSNFKQDINIKAKIMKTCTLPKFNMETPLSINKQVDNIFRDWSNNKSSLNTTFKKFSKLNTIIRVKNKYILDLNIEQKATIQSWIVECKKLYNICLDKQNQDNTLFNKGYKSIKKGIFDDVYQDFKKPAPYDVLTDEIRVFDSNLKSCRTNYKNGYINQFTLKPKSFKNENYSLLIPYKSIFKNGIFKNILGEINNFSLDTLPSHDSRLYYNARNNTYSLNIIKFDFTYLKN